jgi:phosphohistidine phosphatase
MKRLTLVRHAKAEDAVSGQDDWNRALATKGQRDARKMGERLKARKRVPDLILTSPALRAITTAKIVARAMGITESGIREDDRLYLASPKKIIEVAHEFGARSKHLMIFGHNPGITDCADQLSGEREIDAMPTCAIFTACFDVDNWSELADSTGVDVDLDYPDRSA